MWTPKFSSKFVIRWIQMPSSWSFRRFYHHLSTFSSPSNDWCRYNSRCITIITSQPIVLPFRIQGDLLVCLIANGVVLDLEGPWFESRECQELTGSSWLVSVPVAKCKDRTSIRPRSLLFKHRSRRHLSTAYLWTIYRAEYGKQRSLTLKPVKLLHDL